MKLFCKLGYHKYSYDSPSQPSRCICTRCKKKWKLIFNNQYNPIKEPWLYQQWKEIKDEK